MRAAIYVAILVVDISPLREQYFHLHNKAAKDEKVHSLHPNILAITKAPSSQQDDNGEFLFAPDNVVHDSFTTLLPEIICNHCVMNTQVSWLLNNL